MKSKPNRTLQILTSVGAFFYLGFIAMTVFYDGFPIFRPFGLYEALLLIFIAGFVLAWMNKKFTTGIIFMIWNAVVWVSDLYLSRPSSDYSMLSAMASSFMVLGAFFLLEWYTSKETVPTQQLKWKFILRVLLINYAVLYSIVAFSEPLVGEPVDYLSYPYLIYPFMLLIFLVGFILSWKWEYFAGYIFLVWFAILITANVVYSEISTLGGWAMFGVPLLLQGIFYIVNHFKFRKKEILNQ